MKTNYKENYPFLLERALRFLKIQTTDLLREYGEEITLDQWAVVQCINANPGISQTEISRCISRDSPNVNRVVDYLIQNEYIEKKQSEQDHRRYELYITKQGTTLYERILPIVTSMERRAVQNVNSSDIQAFSKILEKMYLNLNEKVKE